MVVGAKVITIVDKFTNEGLKKVFIPKGTIGTVCEIHDDYLIVEIWGKEAPPGVFGVYFFDASEIKEC